MRNSALNNMSEILKHVKAVASSASKFGMTNDKEIASPPTFM